MTLLLDTNERIDQDNDVEMVLIVEDDPDIAELLRYGLEHEHFETRVALTGEEGLRASLDVKKEALRNPTRLTPARHERV